MKIATKRNGIILVFVMAMVVITLMQMGCSSMISDNPEEGIRQTQNMSNQQEVTRLTTEKPDNDLRGGTIYGPNDDVPYICQTDLGDTWYHLVRCAAATHCMAYKWLKTAGKVSKAPTISQYKDATKSYPSDGGTWADVNSGFGDPTTDPKGIKAIFGRRLIYRDYFYSDHNEALNMVIYFLKMNYPIETAMHTNWGHDHSIMIIAYYKGNSVEWFRIDDPAPWYDNGGKYWVEKSWLLDEWNQVYGRYGTVCITRPKYDQ